MVTFKVEPKHPDYTGGKKKKKKMYFVIQVSRTQTPAGQDVLELCTKS